ncbi:CLIP domain-containing serine protease B4 [Zeugodacus cucurbitae]|uniref:CLIP domain-containing serine protease B4 n=1 Tax=Zeugodacus cucurbitae TaxID=28588 RepID=UPI0023D96D50|nr:CLIP domain-containing serine protease B4 [Zeugodacus cucurbitae]
MCCVCLCNNNNKHITMRRWNCLLFLCTFYKVTHGIALSTGVPKCNCIPVKECEPIAYLLLNHKPHEADMIYKIVQSAGCGYAGLEPLVCCPTTYANHKIATRLQASDSDDVYRSTDPDVWVWSSTQFPTRNDALTDVLLGASAVDGRTSKRRSREFYDETDVFDFIDPKTQRNFPHSFYEESVDSDDVHDEAKKHYGSGNVDQKNFKHHHHFGGHDYFTPHHHHHHHHHEYDGGNVYDSNEYGEGEEEYPRTLFRPISDGPVVYPDDRRLNRPLQFPTITTTTTSTTTTTTTKKPTSRPLEQSKVNIPRCGMPDIDAASGERLYPWISRIAYVNKTSNVVSYRCSGSVVSQSHILTAAHCVINLVSDLQLSHVRIGGVALSPNCTASSSVNCSIASRIYQIAEVRVHPNYDQPKYANDIALVKIVGEASAYTPICLPPNLSVSVRDQLIGSPGIALGWTADVEGNDTSSPRVRYLNLPIVNTTECAITYAKFSENFNDPIVITPSQLCAQGGPMNDVCRGDSGGPFMDDGSSGLINTSGRHTLLGIVAFGPTKCGMSNIPGVYTRVSSYLGWIIESISLS